MVLLAGLALAAQPAAGAEPDPDWPCVQILVPTLAASQMWAGPPLEANEDVPADPQRAALAYQLASRATALPELEEELDRFADGLAAQDRNAELAGLFSEALALINQQRSEIIAGIKRYTRKQRRLADKIARDNRQLTGLQPGTVPDAETAELLNERQWDLRVFEDRQHVLRQICEQPVLLDQRAFAVSRIVQARLAPE
jgi:hypothetical protein